MMQKISKVKGVDWTRGEVVSRIVAVGIFVLLAVMMIGGLRTFILYPAGQVDQDIMPSVLGFYLFFLWVTQFSLFLRHRKGLASSPTPLLALFLFILCSFFLSALILSYCNQIRLVTENGLPFCFPGFREVYLFLLQMGNSLWYLDFPWGMFAFPVIGTFAYLPFCIFWARKHDAKRAVRFTALSSGIFLLVSLLFSFSVEAIVVAQQGWPLPPQTRTVSVETSARDASSKEIEGLVGEQDSKTALTEDGKASGDQALSESHASYRYDRQAALDYAAAWFGAYNPAYYAYSQDCANFVSQCLYAGGMPMASAWYSTVDGKAVFSGASTGEGNSADNASDKNVAAENVSADSGAGKNTAAEQGSSDKDSSEEELISPAWRLAQKLFAYYADPQAGFVNGSILSADSSTNMPELLSSAPADGKPIQPGDLLFFAPEGGGEDAINHAVLITGVSGDEIYFSSHNCSRLNEALSPHLSHKSVFIVRLNDVA